MSLDPYSSVVDYDREEARSARYADDGLYGDDGPTWADVAGDDNLPPMCGERRTWTDAEGVTWSQGCRLRTRYGGVPHYGQHEPSEWSLHRVQSTGPGTWNDEPPF